ncbi:hypothetical protein CPU12_01640 [Malaciobacter molluscorum LMG 25693]|uniref:Uncharacterized protein n=1 Tax=Malaciobacter molluscorum LMG 25693 TaxID=870501 RepID=A0A2G1DKN6_9BACT|nr:hypothetical protein [Malaciobacter molluscorum]AXX92549.1 hypothetical protein AMOL_1580 [Malaciobacter molluscorum LMG 25693]PHO18974.1 hypothetical protein CPU12_01640 [Malaciobacter molluscorum LMG 25693]RXJ97278.1 hypothetical protein CRV00_00120 [Malaciobacter molluscorum]
MNNIYYIDEEPLYYLDGSKQIDSFLWKFMYKKVQKRLKKSIINVENIKKIIFNKSNSFGCTIDAPLEYVMLRNEAIFYNIKNEREYYIPLNIGFIGKTGAFDIVLIGDVIDIRDSTRRRFKPKDRLSHTPVLSIKNFKLIEKSFKKLLEHIENEDNKLKN